MLEILKPFLTEILTWGTGVIVIILALFHAKQSGKEIVERKEAMETLRGVQVNAKIKDSVSGSSDDRLNQLHNKWQH